MFETSDDREDIDPDVWGPAMWKVIHMISVGYPKSSPSIEAKVSAHKFIHSLMFLLPCDKCRENFVKEIEKFPLLDRHLENRELFGRYLVNLHNTVNRRLGKRFDYTWDDVLHMSKVDGTVASVSSKHIVWLLWGAVLGVVIVLCLCK